MNDTNQPTRRFVAPLLAAVLGILLLIMAARLLAGNTDWAPSDDDQAAVASPESVSRLKTGFELPASLSFENFKLAYKKTYSSQLEELMRQKLYLSRSFRATVSAVKYKYSESKFYLGVNFLSDATHQELQARGSNGILGDEMAEPVEAAQPIETNQMVQEPLASLMIDTNAAEYPLESQELGSPLGEDSAEQGGHEQLSQVTTMIGGDITTGNSHWRLRRDLTRSNKRAKLQQMRPSKAKKRTGKRRNAAKADKITGRAKETAGPNDKRSSKRNSFMPVIYTYEPADDLIDSQLEADVMEELDSKLDDWLREPGPTRYGQSGGQGKKQQQKQKQKSKEKSKQRQQKQSVQKVQRQPKLPDKVFYDLRNSGCFSKPRDQGSCSSCYAFAIISILEFVHCKMFGKLVAFSEQYLVDCGKAKVEGLRGCNGGSPKGALQFVNKYGLKLRDQYPYIEAEGKCRLNNWTDSKRGGGGVETKIGQMLEVGIEHWAQTLPYGPLFVSVSTTKDFYEYKGGVHGWGCKRARRPQHAMVVVGHGRQDNTEYWLLRNSHSAGWGDHGYYKLAKDADCIHPRVGFMLGSNDGRNLDIKFNFDSKPIGKKQSRRHN